MPRLTAAQARALMEPERHAREAQARREQPFALCLLTPDDHRADALSYMIGRQWITNRPGTESRVVNIRPLSDSFRRTLQHEMEVELERQAEFLRHWDEMHMPIILNPIPPDLALLICAALDEALVYVEPIDDDEPWDDDDYVETAPARSPQVSSGMMTGFVADNTDFEWDDDSEDDF